MSDIHSKRTTQSRCSQSPTAPLSSPLESGAHSVVIGVIVRFARGGVSMRITKIIQLRVKASLMNKRRARSGAFGLLVSVPGSALGCKAVGIRAAVGGLKTVTIGVLVAVGAVVVVCVVRAVCVCVCVCVSVDT